MTDRNRQSVAGSWSLLRESAMSFLNTHLEKKSACRNPAKVGELNKIYLAGFELAFPGQNHPDFPTGKPRWG